MRLAFPVLGAFVGLVFASNNMAASNDADPHQHHQHHEHHQAAAAAYNRTVANYAVPAIPVVTSDGRRLVASDLFKTNKPVLVNFIFTSCTSVCPVMSATFAQLREKLGPKRADVELVSISIDPEQDTPARLREYAQKFKADPHWRFITGTAEDMIALQKAFGAFRGNKNNHIPLTYIRVTPKSQWVRVEGLVSAESLRREVYSKGGM